MSIKFIEFLFLKFYECKKDRRIFDKTNGITTIQFSKQPSIDELFNALDDVERTNLRLWDFSGEGVDLTGNQLLQLYEYSKSKLLRPSKAAILATNDLTFGLSRMMGVYRDKEQSETKVFRTKQEALEWLQS